MRNKHEQCNSSLMYVPLVLFLIVMVAAAVLIYPIPVFGSFLFYLLVVCSLYCLVSWYSKDAKYVCGVCDQQFPVKMSKDFLAPYSIQGRYLRCPSCANSSWARELWM